RMPRLVLLELVLGGERQRGEVGEAADARGLDAGGGELAPVERAVGGGVAHLGPEARGLPARRGRARAPLGRWLEGPGGRGGSIRPASRPSPHAEGRGPPRGWQGSSNHETGRRQAWGAVC